MLIFGTKSHSLFFPPPGSNFPAEITHPNDMHRLYTTGDFLLPSAIGADTVGGHGGCKMQPRFLKIQRGAAVPEGSAPTLSNLFIILHAKDLQESY